MWSAHARKGASAAPARPDEAWRILLLVTEWLRYADAKLGVTLAAAGVGGGVLFNLVANERDGSRLFDTAAVICFLGLLVAGFAAMAGLFSRLRAEKLGARPPNPIFFGDIASAFSEEAQDYATVLSTLVQAPDELMGHLSQQVLENSRIAHRKFRWANRAIQAFSIGLAGLAGVAASIALGW